MTNGEEINFSPNYILSDNQTYQQTGPESFQRLKNGQSCQSTVHVHHEVPVVLFHVRPDGLVIDWEQRIVDELVDKINQN